jgi:nucleotide-binding universal stress UspA family protein
MYRHLLIPTDGSKLSAKAVKTGLTLAKKLGAKVTVIHAIPPYTAPYYEGMMVYVPPSALDPKEYKRNTEKQARAILENVISKARVLGVDCGHTFVTDAQPWNAILKYARANKCDAIVMASHGRRGLAGFLLGSETTKVLTHSKIPVLVCR